MAGQAHLHNTLSARSCMCKGISCFVFNASGMMSSYLKQLSSGVHEVATNPGNIPSKEAGSCSRQPDGKFMFLFPCKFPVDFGTEPKRCRRKKAITTLLHKLPCRKILPGSTCPTVVSSSRRRRTRRPPPKVEAVLYTCCNGDCVSLGSLHLQPKGALPKTGSTLQPNPEISLVCCPAARGEEKDGRAATLQMVCKVSHDREGGCCL